MGNVDSRPSSVNPPPPAGIWVVGWVSQNPREATLTPPPPPVSLSNGLLESFFRPPLSTPIRRTCVTLLQ